MSGSCLTKLSKVLFMLLAGFVLIIVLGLTGLYLASGSHVWDDMGKVSQTNEGYGGGLLKIKDHDILMLQISSPPTQTKSIDPEEWAAGRQHLEYLEPWMADPNERLNRRKLKIIRGTLESGLGACFETPGQDGYWWVSADWQTIYVTSRWIDFTASRNSAKTVSKNTIWKTEDGGWTWRPLPWPEEIDAGVPLFKSNAFEGYLVGMGPKIWRTEDGGESWKEIAVPIKAIDFDNEQKTFPVFDMDEAGTLFFSVEDTAANSTYLYIVPWEEMPDDLNGYSKPRNGNAPPQIIDDSAVTAGNGFDSPLTAVIEFKGQKIIDARRYKSGPLYVLTVKADLSKIETTQDLPPGGTLSRIDGLKVSPLATIPAPITVESVLPGNDGFLLIWASRPAEPLDKPIALLSRNDGKKWKEIKLYQNARGWYFDPAANVLWHYSLLGRLYKRQL